jgi:hypothetical protein
MSKIRVYPRFWTLDDVSRHPECLFVYGDNDIHQGKGGQAIIRDLPNAIGVPTKKYPSNDPSSFYTDAELELNKIKIRNAFNLIIDRSKYYKYVILPSNGLGTGLADLPRSAPQTYQYLVASLKKLQTII